VLQNCATLTLEALKFIDELSALFTHLVLVEEATPLTYWCPFGQ
jgi:hypothetical protein